MLDLGMQAVCAKKGEVLFVPWQAIRIFALPTFYLCLMWSRDVTCDMLFNSCIDHGLGKYVLNRCLTHDLATEKVCILCWNCF